MPSQRRRERKVVTVLFCDLVGFTSRAESLDPEDVEAILRPYHARVRAELERHGGTVEKFIGDAVMALFGAPVAHEDDPERAVRAALAIRDVAAEEELELRMGITTGEALVSLDASPAEGEGMASGDVVNTAARLQSAAPVDGILVDETTYRATREAVDYADAPAVEAKGKSSPVPARLALKARARFGVDVAHEARTELVGRERELGILREAFARARDERTPQLVTLVGVPGMGKSRLVYELSRIADADPELVTWRQGRCLAYGDGVTLWALGEIVKAEAGIVEQDTPGEVAEKIGRAVAGTLGDRDDAARVEPKLLALLGLGEETELGGDRRGVAFAAWRRFLEAMAEHRPVVLVFEDLHWADEILLDFVDELVDWVADVPLLVVATARPELLDRRPGWGGGKLDATTLALSPLTEDQTAALLAQLLGRPVLAADSQRALLERAGGNPLYAEQFVDLFLEQGSSEELPLPETLQGIIAARLDALGEAEKELLKDAAVVGKVFWASSVERDGDVSSTVHALERKGFVRRQRRSSVEGESEYAFAHALVRDVAYGQIARADRADRHRRTAEWIEGLGRPGDHAEMLAHHFRAALELARSSGLEERDLAERARKALSEAGDRAFALNAFASAARYYGDALELVPEEGADHADLLFRHAHALHLDADDRREPALEQACEALLVAGLPDQSAEARALLSQALWYAGRRDEADAQLAIAQELSAGLEPSPAKARVLSYTARRQMLAGDLEAALATAQTALGLAEALSLEELRAHALTTLGTTRGMVADRTQGLRELERALQIALAINSPISSTIANNLAVGFWMAGDAARADELYHESIRIAEQVGDAEGRRWGRGNTIAAALVRGRWDEAVREADEFIAECEVSPHYLEHSAREVRGTIRLARGDTTGALADLGRALAQARQAGDPQALVPSLLHNVRARMWLGRIDEARGLAAEALELIERFPQMGSTLGLINTFAGELGLRQRIRELTARAPDSLWRDAALAAVNGDLLEASKVFERIGATLAVAEARLNYAEELSRAGRGHEADTELEEALAFYRSVGATYLVQRAEALRGGRAQIDSA